MSIKASVFGLIVVALLFLGQAAFFVVSEGEQAIITQFGKPVGKPITEAGLKFKLPFVQEVRRVEKRTLNWDGAQNQVPTKDKKYIIVDTTARWRIIDPLLFIMTLQDERSAISRLDAIIDSATRDVISSHNLVEAVRNTNQILDDLQARAEKRKQAEASGNILMVVEEEITGEIEAVTVGRERLSTMILERAQEEVKKLGIELIDVQLRRISYEASVESKVYERMISERQRIAEKIRSVGKGEQAKIEGKTQRDLLEIQSDAYRKVQQIQGQAEAEAIKIYADAVGRDAGFYEFLRTLEAYKRGVRGDTRFLLSGDSDFFRILRQGQPSQQ